MNIKSILTLYLAASLSACNAGTHQPSPDVDIQQAATSWRFQKPEGNVAQENLVNSLNIQIKNNFPVWRSDITAAIDVSIKNTTKSHIPARTKAILFIYSSNEKKPLYWSNIDLAFGEPAQPNNMSVLSLPVNASKDLSIPVLGTTWASIKSQIWPDNPFYTLVPAGTYLMRLELDLYDDDDNPVGTAVSNFIQFTSKPTSN